MGDNKKPWYQFYKKIPACMRINVLLVVVLMVISLISSWMQG